MVFAAAARYGLTTSINACEAGHRGVADATW
jgi:hypothetical protein